MEEIWKTIENYPLYQASNLGQVKSIDRYDSMGRFKKSKTLSLRRNKGYVSVALCKEIDGRTIAKSLLVHRLVAEAFIPKIADKSLVNHKDGKRWNNNVNNLEWVDARENAIHAIQVLKKNEHLGENHFNTKLNKDSALMIRDLYNTKKYSQYKLALAFHVDSSTIYSIIHNKTWK